MAYVHGMVIHGPEQALGPFCKNIRSWYEKEYPTDDMAEEIKPGARFLDLLEAVHLGSSVYQAIGADDSLIRERCFKELVRIDGCDYDVVYEMWLDANERFQEFKRREHLKTLARIRYNREHGLVA